MGTASLPYQPRSAAPALQQLLHPMQHLTCLTVTRNFTLVKRLNARMATLIPAATGTKILSPAYLPTSLRASIGLHVGAAAVAAGVPAMWPWALGTIALNHLVLLVAGMSPRCALLGPNLRRLPIGIDDRITLTFDDGPDPAVTPRVLDLLDE